MAAHQAPLSLGFSRQEHWSGLPFPSPMHKSEKWKWSRQSCQTLRDPRDSRLPGSFVHGIFQARVLEWVAYPFSSGSSWPRYRTGVSCIAGRFFTNWAIREAHSFSEITELSLNSSNQNIKIKVWLTTWHFNNMITHADSATKRNKIGSFVEMWMDLESIIQNEVSQKERNSIVY